MCGGQHIYSWQCRALCNGLFWKLICNSKSAERMITKLNIVKVEILPSLTEKTGVSRSKGRGSSNGSKWAI